MLRLKGRVAVITGGGQGIGLGIARRFAEEGASIVLVDLVQVRLDGVMAELGIPARCAAVCCDISDTGAPGRIVEAALQRFSRLDILVNNAGIAPRGSISETADDVWDKTIEVNLSAMFRVCRAAIDPLKESGRGRIISISSMNGLVGFRESSAYSIAKAGVVALTRSLAADYSHFGVTANAIAPGVIDTALARQAIAARPPWFRKVVLDATPAGRMGQTADIAGAAAFFASDDACFVSGQVLAVDGGLTATRFMPDE